MKPTRIAALAVCLPVLLAATGAQGQSFGAPLPLDSATTIDPILGARLRYEGVDQAGSPGNAEAVTLRVRAGGEIKSGEFAFLVEGEGTVALAQDYNDTLPFNGAEPFPIVADPENLELNRFQVSWQRAGSGITLGRQRIVLDNARFVGNVGWRQNEQTFDAVRGQARMGPVVLDGTYSASQRTVFGSDSPNGHFDGDLVLLNGGLDLATVDAKGFAYLLDYEDRAAFSSQTYGVLLTGEWPLAQGAKLAAQASYARQADYGANPVAYQAPYLNAQLALRIGGSTITAGYEELGSDGGIAAFQTPLATLHAFNGWADLFLTTPAAGLRDYYAGIGHTIALAKLPAVRAELTYHAFQSDFGGADYGREWDASIGFALGRVGLLAKYARYRAEAFAADTEKFWLQAEIAF
jgi:hypothetical protein